MSSAAYGAADELLEGATRKSCDELVEATAGVGRAILALVDEVEPLVELLRVLVEQHRTVELVDGPGFVDGPRIRSHVVARLDGDVPFVEDPDPFAHDHRHTCAQCRVPGDVCCPHCSGARIGTARGSIGGRT